MNTDGLMARMRSVKHAAWLTRRRAWKKAEPTVAPVIDAGLRAYSGRVPPRAEPAEAEDLAHAPARIFCLWTGENAMSENRRRAMAELRRLNEPEVEVVLVSPDNLDEWVVKHHPMHPSYHDLSLIHRSDYLRAYLMHHHGGGYSDVKAAYRGWAPSFDEINRNDRAWLLGYPEPSYRTVAPAPKPLLRQLRIHHARLIGNGAYIVKSRSPLTAAWLAEAERRLDTWSDALARYPGDVHSGPAGYPVPFYGLLGEIFHPLCLRVHDRVVQDRRITPQLHDYK